MFLKSLISRRGFTLIELLIVIVIIALLMAIAIPSFLSQQKKAQDVGAKVALNVDYKTARGERVGSATGYPPAASLVATLNQSEPSRTFVSGGPALASLTQAAVDPSSSPTHVVIYEKSKSGVVWKLEADPDNDPVITPLQSSSNPGSLVKFLGGINSAATLSNQLTFTVPSYVAANSLLVVGGYRPNDNDPIASATDSQGNIYNVNLAIPGGVGSTVTIGVATSYVTHPLNAGDTITITYTLAPTVSLRSMAVANFSGIAASSFLDASATQVAAGTGYGNPITSNTVSTTQANEVLVGFFYHDRAEQMTPNAGWLGVGGFQLQNGRWIEFEWRPVTSTGSYSASANMAGLSSFLVGLLALKTF